MKKDLAAHLVESLLNINDLTVFRRMMIEADTRYDYENPDGERITENEIKEGVTTDTCLLLYAEALKNKAINTRIQQRTQRDAQNVADGPVANRLVRNSQRSDTVEDLEVMDSQPERAQQMAILQEEADAYVADDDRPEIDVEQLRLWGEDPDQHPALNLEYENIRRQGRSHEQALKECRTASLRILNTIWKDKVFPNDAIPSRTIVNRNVDLIITQIRTELRQRDWLKKFIYPQGIPNAHGPIQAAARREQVERLRGRGDKAYISNKAEIEANKGSISKAQQILLNSKKTVNPTQDAVNSKFGSDRLLENNASQRARPNYKYIYDQTAENTTALADAEDVKRHVLGLRWNAAAGASGMSNKQLMDLIVGQEGNENLDGLTVLLNIILRGWLEHDDMMMLNKCKGVALDKGNYVQDETDIRPICIGEAIMSVTNSFVLGNIQTRLCDIAGVNSGYQVGLERDGIIRQRLNMQLRFELDTQLDEATHVTFKIDVKNAFNELSRVAIRKFLKEKLPGVWPNFLIQQYSIDAEVDFGNNTIAHMRTGTQQGCKTSAHLFDAVIHSHLKTNNLFTEFHDCQINAIHDDTICRAPVARATALFTRIVQLYEQLGLQINTNKTEILFRGNLQEIKHIQGLEGLAQLTNKISDKGIVFGGLPIGYDRYIIDYVILKIEEYEQLANRLINNSTDLNVGSIFSIVRFCLSAKWPYLMRALPSEIWDTPYKGFTLGKYIDSISLRTILAHMDITKFRQELDEEELNSLHIRLGLRLKNGGLGVHTVQDYCKTAMLGMWATNVDQIITSLGVLTPDDINALEVTNTVQRITDTAKEMRTKFSHANAFSTRQATDIGLNTGAMPIINSLNKLAHHGAIRKEDSQALRGGKHQGKLRTALNMYKANRLTDRIAEMHNSEADRIKDPNLRAFIAQRSPIANRWLNRMHLDKNARLLTSAQVKVAFWTTVGINLVVENRDCKHCNMKLVNWFEHGQVCKRSRKRKQIDNQIKYFTRSWPLHKQIEKLLTESLTKIPDVTVTDHNPKILDTFQMNPENPFVAPQRVQGNVQLDLNEEEEPALHRGRIIAMPYGNSRTKGSQYGDLKIVTSFPGDIQKAM
ncbi:MAG: reverse transcriptase domain-containing protein, partial [bacterium]